MVVVVGRGRTVVVGRGRVVVVVGRTVDDVEAVDDEDDEDELVGPAAPTPSNDPMPRTTATASSTEARLSTAWGRGRRAGEAGVRFTVKSA